MVQAMDLFSSFVSNTSAIAFLVGALGSVVYSKIVERWPVPHAITRPKKKTTGPRRRSKRQRYAAVACFSAGAVVVIAFIQRAVVHFGFDEMCPPDTGGRADTVVAAPLPLLALTKVALPSACEQLSPLGSSSKLPIMELRVQIQCHTDWIISELPIEDKVHLLVSGRELLDAIRSRAAEAGDVNMWATTQVEWTHALHSLLHSNCHKLYNALQHLRRSSDWSRLMKLALKNIYAFKRLEFPFRELLAAMKQSVEIFSSRRASGSTEASNVLEDLENKRASALLCMIGTVREARSVGAALPRRNADLRHALRCSSNLLVGIEELTVSEAEKETDAGVTFGLGMYWSEVGVNGLAVPFFGVRAEKQAWQSDLHGLYVPSAIARADELLQRAEQASLDVDRADRAAARAARLYEHAKLCVSKHHDAAAEWRFALASHLAAVHQHGKLAAHSAARWSYFLTLRGRHEEALEAADQAVSFFDNAFALYLQAMLRHRLGKLKTDDEVRQAEEQLLSVANKLPSDSLENDRMTLHADLRWWRAAVRGGLKACFTAPDVVRLLICIISRMAFEMPSIELVFGGTEEIVLRNDVKTDMEHS